MNGILSAAKKCGILASDFARESNKKTAKMLASYGKTIEDFRKVARLPKEGGHLHVLTAFVGAPIGRSFTLKYTRQFDLRGLVD